MSGTVTGSAKAGVDAAIRGALDAQEITYVRSGEGAYLVTLPGTHKLATMCWLVAGEHALLVEAFVMRRPDENREQLYDFMLQRNARMYAVAFSVDATGDIYLVGRVALHSVTAEEVDRLLGSVLSYADDTFDAMLEIGFATSIRKEWAWRVKRGESLANLQAFARFADPGRP
ncbi:MAG: YbjN domain-containing protein [Pseudonocardiales bacterium]